MVKTSLMGTFCLALFVDKWNTSEDVESKMKIRTLLASSDTMKIHAGIKRLFDLVEQSMKDNLITGPERFIFSLCATFSNEAIKGSSKDQYAEARDNIRADLAYYFGTMFRAGYIHHIPMPHFGYSTDPHAEE